MKDWVTFLSFIHFYYVTQQVKQNKSYKGTLVFLVSQYVSMLSYYTILFHSTAQVIFSIIIRKDWLKLLQYILC